MPEQQNQGFLAKYLPDILEALGAGTAVGSFFTPNQLQRVLQQRPNLPLHPAVWRNLSNRDKGLFKSPTSSESTRYQSGIDKMMIYNANKYRNEKDLFKNSGWYDSATMGPVREIPDTGSTVSMTPAGTYRLEHPYVDMHKLYDIPAATRDLSKAVGNASYHFDEYPYMSVSLDPKPLEMLHEFGHVGQHDAGVIAPNDIYQTAGLEYRNPRNWNKGDLKAVAETTEGFGGDPNRVWYDLVKASNTNDISHLDDFRNRLSYVKQAPEAEAFNIENRFMNPLQYNWDPQSTQFFPNSQLYYRIP